MSHAICYIGSAMVGMAFLMVATHRPRNMFLRAILIFGFSFSGVELIRATIGK